MFNFFKTILAFFSAIVPFIVNIIESLVYVVQFLAQGIIYVNACTSTLPAWVLPFIYAIVAYSVVITIINKGE